MRVKGKEKRIAVLVGIALCILTLALSAVLQHSGYLDYLDGDVAAEAILAKRQADTSSLVQMDWLYSTEIRLIGPTQLYALGFSLGMGYEAARIFGNTLTLALGMAACVLLLRSLRISLAASLAASAMIPLACSSVYAYAVTVGGFYAHHWLLAMLSCWLWLRLYPQDDGVSATAKGIKRARRGHGYLRLAAYALICAALGLLSVRFVLCFVCPMLAAAVLDAIFARDEAIARRIRFAALTAVGFVACVAGYAASEIVVPRLFISGYGASSSFLLNPLDGPSFVQTLAVVFAGLLKLLGWQGNVRLFSGAGVVNLLVAAVLFFGVALLVRALRHMGKMEKEPCDDAGECASATRNAACKIALAALDVAGARRMLLLYACAAFAVNLFCFLFISGAYLNRYLIVAVIFFVPALPVALEVEENPRLRAVFVLLLAGWLALASAMTLAQTRAAEVGARERGEGMRQAIEALEDMGYSHGYGTFWNVRVMEERSQGALTFTGLRPAPTEENALVPYAPEFIRWLEPDGASSLDACEGPTFLILTREERGEWIEWLALTGAPVVFENTDYVAYGFGSSQAFVTDMLLGSATLEVGDTATVGEGGLESVTLGAGGRLRMPPGYREVGSYALSFVCEGEPAQDAIVRAYSGSDFELIAEQPLAQGENRFAFELDLMDKYFMLQILAGETGGLRLTDICLERAQAQ